MAEGSDILREQAPELCRLWRARHLGAVALGPDLDAVDKAHHRAPALVGALRRALSARKPDDWGAFSHREAVQVATLVAWALAEDGASPAAAGSFAPCLGAALEELGAERLWSLVVPLASVVAEGYNASRLASIGLREQRRLGAATPVIALPAGTILVVATGCPGLDAANAVVDRATDLALALERPWLVLDVSHLEGTSPAALAALLGLADDISRLEGTCLVAGLSADQRTQAEAVGFDLSTLELRGDAAEAMSEALARKRLLRRLLRRLR